MRKRLPIALLCCLLLLSAVRAGEFYVGGALGQTSFDIADEAARFKVDDWGGKLFGGYRLFRYLAVEAAYMDAGKLDETQNDVRIEAEARALTASALGILAFTPRFEFFARAGFANWNSDVTFTDNGVPESRDDSGTEFFWGFGFAYDFTERFGIRLELEHFTFENDDVRFGSVGVRYTF